MQTFINTLVMFLFIMSVLLVSGASVGGGVLLLVCGFVCLVACIALGKTKSTIFSETV
ncbi:MAG: hypothetical protein H6797_04400 [Candidatus Nomurabacteria bacterium]|nr:MAG: hypothetical protein H6797_04400 [Candidatus Nomurabacteria bacterium]